MEIRRTRRGCIRQPGFIRVLGVLAICAAFSFMLIAASCNSSKSSQSEPPPELIGQAIVAWGGNSSGQIGDGSTSQRLDPVVVPIRNIRSIAAGGQYSVLL